MYIVLLISNQCLGPEHTGMYVNAQGNQQGPAHCSDSLHLVRIFSNFFLLLLSRVVVLKVILKKNQTK